MLGLLSFQVREFYGRSLCLALFDVKWFHIFPLLGGLSRSPAAGRHGAPGGAGIVLELSISSIIQQIGDDTTVSGRWTGEAGRHRNTGVLLSSAVDGRFLGVLKGKSWRTTASFC